MPEKERIKADDLETFCTAAFTRAGMQAEDAALVSRILVDADLKGVDSHGVWRMPQYVHRLQNGENNPRPQMKVLRESPASALIDADNALGQLGSAWAMEVCINKARQAGMAVVGVKNSNDFTRAAYYSAMALKYDLIGFCTTNAPPVLTPVGGTERTTGNNPLSFAIPSGRRFPIVLDMAFSMVAGHKIMLAREEGRKIPLGWLLNEEGQPVDDPSLVPRGIIPAAGGYKGFALAVIMDVLAGVLTGALFAREFTPLSTRGCGHLFASLDPNLFLPVEEFKARVDEMIGQVKSSPLATGAEKIYLPGEREWEEKERRQKEGIPLPVPIRRALQQLAQELQIKAEFL